jgi:predicted enzyme related to lactoylglutathione lyase
MACKVVHFEVLGKDGANLQKFYGDLFDWEINADNPMNYGLVTGADGSVGGGIGSAQEGMPGHVTFYIEVDDIDKYLQQIESKGGKTMMPKTHIPDMVTFALFADPEGNMVGLVEAM